MNKKKSIPDSKKKIFERFASAVTAVAGSTRAFMIASVFVLAWAVSVPFFHFSEKWLLFFNTITDMVIFLMVFLLQKTQNKDSLAIQLKLSELLSSHEPARKELVNAENKTEEELKDIRKFYNQGSSEEADRAGKKSSGEEG